MCFAFFIDKLVPMNEIVCCAFSFQFDLLSSFFLFRNQRVGMEEFDAGYESNFYLSWKEGNKKW